MAAADTRQKNLALSETAKAIDASREALKKANSEDLSKGEAAGLDSALLDRLELNDDRISGMIEGLQQVSALPDPVGEITDLSYRPSGIQVGRMRVPLGVVGIIYESRPNVTVDAASLCLKAGNAAILRGGSEAHASNQMIASAISAGLKSAGLPESAVSVVETTDRAAVGELITMKDSVDVIVPRGGRGLIERVSSEATIPVIKHLDGVCHVYIDEHAAQQKAIDIAFNAKCRRYGICGAMETLLVHEAVASEILPKLAALYAEPVSYTHLTLPTIYSV